MFDASKASITNLDKLAATCQFYERRYGLQQLAKFAVNPPKTEFEKVAAQDILISIFKHLHLIETHQLMASVAHTLSLCSIHDTIPSPKDSQAGTYMKAFPWLAVLDVAANLPMADAVLNRALADVPRLVAEQIAAREAQRDTPIDPDAPVIPQVTCS